MNDDDFRYSHDEIEYACGGEIALMVREKVMARRERINAETAIELEIRRGEAVRKSEGMDGGNDD